MVNDSSLAESCKLLSTGADCDSSLAEGCKLLSSGAECDCSLAEGCKLLSSLAVQITIVAELKAIRCSVVGQI